MQQTLGALRPAMLHVYGRHACLPGTRTDIIQFITEWIVSPSEHSSNVLWLHGVVGSGKSALSMTIANTFQEMGRLGAHIFFGKGVAEKFGPSSVIRTLAYQLGSFDHRIGHAIESAIDCTPDILQSSSHRQFLDLLVKPLASLDMLAFEGPIVIIVDALDQCGTPDDREELLKVLAQESRNIPSVFRFVITSRPEYDIRYYFQSQENILPHTLAINVNNSRNDIEAFFRHRLAQVRFHNKYLQLPDDWPGDSAIHALVERASGLFIWASIACKFIHGYDPRSRLRILLEGHMGTEAGPEIDELYITTLESVGQWDETGFSAAFRAVVGMVLVARDLLSITAVERLLPSESHRTPVEAISRLGCLLDMNGPIRLLHPSFADFLTNRLRCKRDDWFIDLSAHNLNLTINCLDRLDAFLTYNICCLQVTSTPRDASLPEDLSYACTFWIDHVCRVDDAYLIANTLEEFILKHLLHWFEAMSILKSSRNTIGLIRHLLDWLDVRSHS